MTNLAILKERRDALNVAIAEAEAAQETEDKKALTFIVDALHGSICGKVPGHTNRDLMLSHEEAAQAILVFLKGPQ